MARRKPSAALPAKLTAPKFGKVVPRTRLFERLDAAWNKPVIWISAPAGSGKTTLVSSYLDACQKPSLWYQIDEGDADLATFFYYLGMASRKMTPRYRRPLPLLTPEYSFGVPTFARRFFEALASRLKSPSVLVFDNYQEIPAASPFHQILCAGLSALPDTVTTLIVSRSEPPPAYAGKQAGDQFEVVGWNDLRLTLAETKGIAQLQEIGQSEDKLTEWLHEKAQGWAAGLVLMIRALKSDGIGPDTIKDLASDQVFDYFANELFDQLDTERQNFLLDMAFIPQITSPQAETLTGKSSAGRMLSELNRTNFFTDMRGGSSQVFQFHPLFREFLLNRANQIFPAGKLQSTQRRAAALLVESGQIDDAAKLLIACSAWKEMSQLVLDNAHAMIVQGRGGMLDEWLAALPPEVLDDSPWLLYWRGMGKLALDTVASRDHLEKAYGIFKSGENIDGLYLSWAGIVDTFVFAWTDFSPLDYWIEEIEWLLKRYPDFPSAEIQARVTSGIFCALMYRQPDHPDMGLWEERTLGIVLSSTEPYLQLSISSHLILYYAWWNGRQTKADLLVRTLHNTAKTFESAPFTMIVWKSLEGAFLWMACQFEAAAKSLEQGIATAESSGILVWNAMLYASQIYSNLTQGRFEDAARYLDKMSFVTETGRNLDIAHYYFLRGFESLALGRHQIAIEFTLAAMKKADAAGEPYVYHFFMTCMADILIEQDQDAEAREWLERTVEFGRRMKSFDLEYQYHWLNARAALYRNDRAAAREHLRSYLRISRENRIVNHAWWRSPVMAVLLGEALDAGIEVDHVRELIRLHSLSPPDVSRCHASWPWAVKICSLGKFGLEVNGKPAVLPAKRQNRQLEFLKVLVALDGRNVSEQQISDLLWPEAEGDLARQNFKVTLHRLRRLIGQESVVLSDGRLSLDPNRVWVDTWDLERVLDTLAAAKGDRIPGLAAEAADRFAGGLLRDETAAWVIPARERLRNRFLRAVGQAAERLCEQGQWSAAIDCYGKALEVDPLVERFHLGLMRCHHALGQTAEGLLAYRHCRDALADGLQVAPSALTEQWHERLRGIE